MSWLEHKIHVTYIYFERWTVKAPDLFFWAGGSFSVSEGLTFGISMQALEALLPFMVTLCQHQATAPIKAPLRVKAQPSGVKIPSKGACLTRCKAILLPA